MFPLTSQTIRIANETNSDTLGVAVLSAGDRYIENITINSNANQINTVYCGSVPMITERTTNFMNQPMNWNCNSVVTADLYRKSSITITYLNDNGSTTPLYTQGFSYGEVLMSFFLFMIFAILITTFIHKLFIGEKKKVDTWEIEYFN